MRLAAATLVAVSCGLLAAAAVGMMPSWHRRRRRRAAGRSRTWLRQAGLSLSPARFVAGSAAMGLLACLVLTAATGSVFVALVPACALALVPRAYYGRRRVERLRRVQAAWPDGLRDLLSSVAAGRSLHVAVADLARTGPEALREALARYPDLAAVLGVVPALEVIREDLADPTSDRVLEVLILAHERGGQVLAEILRSLLTATTRDLRLLDEIESEGLEMKINARAVVVLPWVVLVFLTMSRGPFRDFYRTGRGAAVLVVGAAMSVIGLALVSRLGREPREPRVLARSGDAT